MEPLAEVYVHHFDRRALYCDMKEAFFSLDPHWRITYASVTPSTARSLQYVSEVLGRCLWDEYPESVGTEFYQHLSQAVRDQTPAEFVVSLPDCQTWFSVRAYPQPSGLAVYLSDVTDLMRTSLENEQHYRSLFDHNPDLVYSLDLDGRFTTVNPAASEIFGCSGQGMLGMRFHQMVYAPDLDKAVAHFERTLQGIPENFEARIRSQKKIYHLNITNIPIIVAGSVVGIYGVAKDITGQRQTEQALAESRNFLEQAQRMAHVGSWDRDMRSNRLTWSEETWRIFGMKPREFLDYRDFFQRIHPDDLPHIQAAFASVLAGEGQYNVEYRVLRPDGEMRTVHSQGEAVYKEQNLVRIWGSVQDITEFKRTEEYLLRSEKLSAVGQLAAGVAHEIRNPLTALKGFLQLMEPKEPLPEKKQLPEKEQEPEKEQLPQQRYVNIMKDELSRIEGIVSELLILAKPQAVHFRRTDVLSQLSDIVTLLNAQAILNNVVIVTQFPENVPPIQAEPNQLKQVFVNVMKNAIEAMQQGGKLTIQVDIFEGQVRVRFADEGNGIAPEVLSKLGEPFYTTKEKGTGLGLAVCCKILDMHRGTLDIESIPNRGSTVTICLPCEVQF